MRVLALVAIIIAAVAAIPSNPQRIVGGLVTTIDQYPSIAALLYSSNLNTYWQDCGATILNQRSLLTAAHCVAGDAAVRWRTRVGSTWANSGGFVHNTQAIIVHANYNSGTNDNDIAILRTTSVIVQNNNAQPGSIAGPNYNVADNQVVWAAGWGSTSFGGPFSEQLRHVQIWSINQNTCNQRYGGAITANMMCSGWLDVGGRDQCQGDSGGPLYHNGVVVGVCSWGAACADPYYPGINARVSRYTSWIQANA